MNMTGNKLGSLLLVIGLCTILGQAALAQDWQERRLLAPTTQEQLAEQRGRVAIYDGLHESVVDRALDADFARIDNMMFVRTRHDSPDGTEWVDDDCD